MPHFHPGDQVQLQEGGPPMLVTNDNADGSVICFWFSETEDQLVWRRFRCDELRAAAANGPLPAAMPHGARRSA